MTKRTCSIQGCGKPHYGRGWCQNHWTNWRRTGTPTAFVQPPRIIEPDLPGERWLPVPRWESLYEVSDLGRVRSLPRKTVSGWRGGKILKPQPDSKGYLFVVLAGNGSRIQARVHVLVAEAFIGPRPPGADVCHGPRGKLCNKPSNLRYGTRSENIMDAVAEGTHFQASKERCPTCGSEYRFRESPPGRICPRIRSHKKLLKAEGAAGE